MKTSENEIALNLNHERTYCERQHLIISFRVKIQMLYNFRKNRNRYDNLLINNRDRSSIDVQI